MDLFSEHSAVFSGTWPVSGMTHGGVAYALPMPELPTAGSGSSSLPTPRATRGGSGTETMYLLGASRDDSNRTQGEVLLKTPTAQLAVNGGAQHPDQRKAGGHGPTLADEVEFLLPTPLASDRKGGGTGSNRNTPQMRDVPRLLPTPAAANPNDGEDLTQWQARRERVKATGVNGNGFGTPLAIAVQLLPTPKASDSYMDTPSTSGRPVEMSTHLGTQVMLQAGYLDHRRGVSSGPRSTDGGPSSDAMPPPLPGLMAETDATGSTLNSRSG